ncbi:Putative 2-dehydropantoate 2-reductase [bacterium HR40]|nr:Putative 2-dehydropantoate 2-reductase [bacterium HR40]
MRIAVIGAGGVGGSVGAMLQQAGFEVAFLARGAHAQAMAELGLSIVGPAGERRVAPVRLLDPERLEGPFDIVLVTVKMYDLAELAPRLSRLLGPQTAVIPLENGVEAPDILARHLPSARVCGGVARIGAAIEAPGRIRVTTPFAVLRFGEREGGPSERLARFAAACARAGIDGVQVTDIARELWGKFVFLAPFATITAASGLPIGAVRDDPTLWAAFARLLAEAEATARAHGIRLEPDFAERTFAFVKGLPPAMTSSMATDLAHGRRLELDWLTGAVVRFARAAGIGVPETERFYARLLPFRDGRPTAG